MTTPQGVVTNGDVVIVEEDQLDVVVENGFVEEEVESHLYDTSLVEELDFTHLTCFKPAISPSQPGPGLRVRSLASGDFDRGEFRNLKCSIIGASRKCTQLFFVNR